MANVTTYRDLALEKFTGLDPYDYARDFLDIVEKKIAFSLGTRPPDDSNPSSFLEAYPHFFLKLNLILSTLT